jgi:hypothetical protein
LKRIPKKTLDSYYPRGGAGRPAAAEEKKEWVNALSVRTKSSTSLQVTWISSLSFHEFQCLTDRYTVKQILYTAWVCRIKEQNSVVIHVILPFFTLNFIATIDF